MSEQPLPHTAPQPTPPPPEEERTWITVAHGSAVAHLLFPLLAAAVPLGTYLAYRERSKRVAFHSLQALLYQLVVIGGGLLLAGLSWSITLALLRVLVGALCIPFAAVVSLIPLGGMAYGVYAAINTYQDQDFRYPYIADWAERLLESQSS